MENIPTPDAGSDMARAETSRAKAEPPVDHADMVDAWRQVLRRRAEKLAGRWSPAPGSAAHAGGHEIFHWVARICAAEDVLREVQAPPAGSSHAPAGDATNASGEPTAAIQEVPRQTPELRVGAGYDPARMLEALFAQPLRDLFQHLLPTVEYQEVVQPVVAEIHHVYTRILFRPPTADEIARHVGAFYERCPSLADRCQAARGGYGERQRSGCFQDSENPLSVSASS